MEKGRATVFLLVVLLAVSAYAFVGSVKAEESETRIRFNATAAGDCFLGYGGPGPGYPSPYEWYGLGRGSAGISGSAEAVPFPGTYLDVLGDVYLADSVEAHGFVSVNWVEESGSKHSLRVVVHSEPSTGLGLFIPEADAFGVPITGHPDSATKALAFNGVHISGSVVQRISGIALFMAFPAGFSPMQPPTSVISITAYLMDIASMRLYYISWLNEQVTAPIDGPGSPTILVPEANVFHRKVEIM